MATTKTTQKKSVPAQEVTRALDANYAKVADMVAAGWTPEQLEALKTAPRSRAAACPDPNDKFTWPLVNGYRLLYSFFTREEKDLYNPWYQAHHPKATSGSATVKMTPEQKALWDELLEITSRSKNPRAHELAIALMPKPKNGPLQRLFGIDDISQLNTKVTLDWILYRGKDECRGSNAKTFTVSTAIKEFGDSFHAVLLRSDVEKMVNELEAKGTKVRNCIIGL